MVSCRLIILGTGVTPTTDSPTGTFERVAVGDAYTVSNYDPVIANEDITPPSRITDIQVIDIHSGLPSTSTTRNYTITWTAPGDDANVGQGRNKPNTCLLVHKRLLYFVLYPVYNPLTRS